MCACSSGFVYITELCMSLAVSEFIYQHPYVLVISHYKDDIIVITQEQGGAEVNCNDNDVICVMGYK